METILLLLVVAIFLFLGEIFLPGGVLAIIGSILLIAAAWVAYEEFGLLQGVLTFISTFTLVGFFIYLQLKILPKTRFGKMLLHQDSIRETGMKKQATDEIIGKEGETLTTLAPTGTVVIDGRKYEAFSRSGLLHRGEPVRVIEQDTFRLIVVKA